jgi:hypothetical protein
MKVAHYRNVCNRGKPSFHSPLNDMTEGEFPSACDDAGDDALKMGAASLRFLQGCGSFL